MWPVTKKSRSAKDYMDKFNYIETKKIYTAKVPTNKVNRQTNWEEISASHETHKSLANYSNKIPRNWWEKYHSISMDNEYRLYTKIYK